MGKKLTIESEEKVIRLLREGFKAKEISEIAEVSLSAVSKISLKHGLRQKGKCRYNVTEKEIDIMVDMHLSGKPFKEIEKFLGRSYDAVKTALGKRGYKNAGAEGSNRKYYLDKNTFDVIDTKEKAYWLGVLMADGSNVEKDYKVTLTQAENNKQLVYAFKEFLKSDHNIYVNKRSMKNANWQDSYSLAITSKTLSKSLAKHGIVSSKSSICKFPNIAEKFYSDFILGYFDGDGHISKNRFEICGTLDIVKAIQDILVRNCNLNYTKLKQRHPDRNNNNYDLVYGGKNQLLRIYNYLYANKSIYLQRKKEKFQNI